MKCYFTQLLALSDDVKMCVDYWLPSTLSVIYLVDVNFWCTLYFCLLLWTKNWQCQVDMK